MGVVGLKWGPKEHISICILHSGSKILTRVLQQAWFALMMFVYVVFWVPI